MAKTGIHIKRANIGAVEAHNERSKEYLEALAKAGRPLYFFPDLTSNNSSWVNPRYQGKTCRELFDERLTLYGKKHHTKDGKPKKPILEDRKRVNKKTGKEYTVAGWSPIREGCPPIKEETTFEDFQPVIDWARENGLDVIRIDLHHDEGHDEMTGGKKERKLNRHAHLIFDWVNPDSGETIKLEKTKMSELQTILADALGMERGESKDVTGLDHVSYAEYREKKAEERAMSLEQNNHVLQGNNEDLRRENAELVEKKYQVEEDLWDMKEEVEAANEELMAKQQMLKDTCEGIEVAQSLGNSLIDLLTGKTSQKRKEGVITLAEAQKRAHDAEEQVKVAKDQLKSEKERADNVIAEWGAWKKENQKELDNVGNLKKEYQTLKEQYEFAKCELETFKDGMAKRIDNFMRLHEEGHTIGLSPEQCNRLWKMPRNQDLEVDQLALDGEVVFNPAPKQDKWKVRLTFGDNLRIMLGAKWQLVADWMSKMRKRLQKKAEELSVNTRKRGRSG